MKFVINRCYGGFDLSEKAYHYLGLENNNDGYIQLLKIPRYDPKLVECVETLGDEENGNCSKIAVVEVNIDDMFDIVDYDGLEKIRIAQSRYYY